MHKTRRTEPAVSAHAVWEPVRYAQPQASKGQFRCGGVRNCPTTTTDWEPSPKARAERSSDAAIDPAFHALLRARLAADTSCAPNTDSAPRRAEQHHLRWRLVTESLAAECIEYLLLLRFRKRSRHFPPTMRPVFGSPRTIVARPRNSYRVTAGQNSQFRLMFHHNLRQHTSSLSSVTSAPSRHAAFLRNSIHGRL